MPIVKLLVCLLTEPERDARARKAAELAGQAEAIAERRKAAVLAWRTEERELHQQAAEAQQAARTGAERRPVECAEELSGADMLLIRQDTGEVVDRRPATAEEMTIPMFDDARIVKNIDQPKATARKRRQHD